MAPRARPTDLRRTATYGEPSSRNALVRGDNLDVLPRLAMRAKGHFRLVYVDPPYNTGRTFKEYRDARRPDEWRAMMRARLELLPALLREDGTLVFEIDDTELGSSLVLLDDIFGRENRVTVITLVRSATTGHKAINRGPINVADYLLVYAKDKRSFSPNTIHRERTERDPAYSTWLENPKDAPAKWRFVPLARAVARELGFESRLAAVRKLGKVGFESHVRDTCLARAEHVVRFAQPRYEAVSLRARAAIDRSRAEPERIFVLERAGHRPMILRGGNRLLFLADKVRTVGGRRAFVEPLTNVWDDLPFQGIAREGGVTFSRNKKPERLMERILELFTVEGDAVLDPFLGSGTTAAVAHKMNREWTGIESANAVVDELALPRLERVVAGLDTTGISRERERGARGGFSLYE